MLYVEMCFSTSWAALCHWLHYYMFQGKLGEDGKPGAPGKVVIPYYNFFHLYIICSFSDIMQYDRLHICADFDIDPVW